MTKNASLRYRTINLLDVRLLERCTEWGARKVLSRIIRQFNLKEVGRGRGLGKVMRGKVNLEHYAKYRMLDEEGLHQAAKIIGPFAIKVNRETVNMPLDELEKRRDLLSRDTPLWLK